MISPTSMEPHRVFHWYIAQLGHPSDDDDDYGGAARWRGDRLFMTIVENERRLESEPSHRRVASAYLSKHAAIAREREYQCHGSKTTNGIDASTNY